MAVILPNAPKGYSWGWYSREDPRMHLQTVDSKHMNEYKVWLENKGKLRFEPHTIGRLAGVHKAVAADLDGDGDLDVAACALTGAVKRDVAATLPSLVWLEQVKPGRFEKHTLEVGNPVHATLAAGDVDGDGDADLVTGTLALFGKSTAWLDVWENKTPPKPKAK